MTASEFPGSSDRELLQTSHSPTELVPFIALDSQQPLGHIPLFAALSGDEQRALFATMRVQAVAPNQTIFWRGDSGESLYLVSKGQVAVTVPTDDGQHVTLDYLGPGGFFGEISLLDGGPRTATVRATELAELYVLRRDDFHAFLRQRPAAAIEILTVMGRRQRISTEALRGMKNPNVAFESMRITLWQRVSDVIATVAASSAFTVFHLAWFGGWIIANLLASHEILPASLAFDPYPFGLLTMVVSLEAIFLSIFVMVSQNRQAEKDRLRIDLDYQVNVKAQTEIVMLARKLERIESHLLGDMHMLDEDAEAENQTQSP
jgi:CRP/FNR family cyclic AMP-dependent transcriptional regulator